ncbi:pseudaminic acid synthase [bacterium]|nr:pseudaminic acid synthase [bacterium]
MKTIQIGGRKVGAGFPTYIIAELSANHGQRFEEAVKLVHAAKASGADAIKLQTYTPDTMTISCDLEPFKIKGGTPWDGRTLYDLYGEAYTPWEWHQKLKDLAESLGMDLFSTPFDESSVDFLSSLDVPVYKIASFELVDLPLIQKVAKTGKPMIVSTGMATVEEIGEAVETIQSAGNSQIILLKCTSAYPAPESEMNIRTIPDMVSKFQVPVGLSDHTLGVVAPVAAVALGACVIEKHFTLSRKDGGPDSAFSLEPHEFKEMVDAVRSTESALGKSRYGVNTHEEKNKVFRRSLFVVKDIKAGETLSAESVRVIRPGHGLAPKHLPSVLGKKANQDIQRGTPLAWELISE